jgi:hypothetical protein
MKALKLTTLAAALVMSANSAFAAPIFVNAGENEDFSVDALINTGDGAVSVNQVTDVFNQFDFALSPASSEYFDTDLSGDIDVGDVFIDRGINVSIGLIPSETETSGGFGSTFSITAEYLLYGAVVPFNGSLAGAVVGGFFNLFYNDLTDAGGFVEGESAQFDPTTVDDRVQVLSAAVTGSGVSASGSGISLGIDAIVDFGFLDPLDPNGTNSLVQDFLELETAITIGGLTSTNVFDLAAAGAAASTPEFVPLFSDTTLQGEGGDLPAIEDLALLTSGQSTIEGPLGSDRTVDNVRGFEIDPTGLTPIQQFAFGEFLAGVSGVEGNGDLSDLSTTFNTALRSGEVLDGNLSIQVPEPSMLGVLGLGLLLVGARRRFS